MATIVRHFKLLCAFAAVLACGGCASTQAPREADVASAQDAYFVMGITPDIAKPFVIPGEMSGSKYDIDGFSRPVSNSEPVDGYIVAKVKPDVSMSIGMLFMHNALLSWGLNQYQICDGGKMPVFSVPPGAVVYIADVNFSGDYYGMRWNVSHHNLEDVRAYLKSHHPRLADKLVQGKFELLPISGRICS
jgi:hypothetical protein